MTKRHIGVLIGRFQIHALTDGHKYLFAQVAARAHRVLALVGVPPVNGRKRDPLEYGLRARMLQDYWTEAYPNGPELIVAPQLDCPDDDEWAGRIDQTIDALAPGYNAIVYCGPDGCGPLYRAAAGRWPIEQIDAIPGHQHATAHRAALTPRHSEDFRAGVVYASERRFLNPYLVVDVAVFASDRILLARKRTDPSEKWRLVGGFVDVGEILEHAAAREVLEETGLEVQKLQYVGSATIPDWRYRGTPETLISACFIAQYVFGTPKATDDIESVRWFALDHASQVIHPDHAPLLTNALAAIFALKAGV